MSLCRFLPTPSDRMGILWSLLCIEDSVIVEYGPAGTTHYSMSLFGELGIDQQNRLFSTHMSEDDVVMGDVSRLEKALIEIDENYAPKVIFVVASSVSAVIGSDLRGVCAYMQERIKARLIAFEQGGFRGDYSIGIKEAYHLLIDELARKDAPKKPNTYNILGMSAGVYRSASDLNEIKRLMREAFGMECGACLCLETDIGVIEACGGAEISLVLRDEALPAAKLLEKRCGVPMVAGAPYGYKGTMDWLNAIAEKLGRRVNPALTGELQKRMGENMSYRMVGLMLKENLPNVTILGDYMTVKGLSGLMEELNFPVTHKICAHCLRAYSDPDAEIQYLPDEKDKINIMRGLDHALVLADDIAKTLIPANCTFMRVSSPLVDGAVIAKHMPIMGPRGADWILESVETYLQTLN